MNTDCTQFWKDRQSNWLTIHSLQIVSFVVNNYPKTIIVRRQQCQKYLHTNLETNIAERAKGSRIYLFKNCIQHRNFLIVCFVFFLLMYLITCPYTKKCQQTIIIFWDDGNKFQQAALHIYCNFHILSPTLKKKIQDKTIGYFSF